MTKFTCVECFTLSSSNNNGSTYYSFVCKDCKKISKNLKSPSYDWSGKL